MSNATVSEEAEVVRVQIEKLVSHIENELDSVVPDGNLSALRSLYNMEKRWTEHETVVRQQVDTLMMQIELLRTALGTLHTRTKHWPRDGQGVNWNPATEPHSAFCPGCLIDQALASESSLPPRLSRESEKENLRLLAKSHIAHMHDPFVVGWCRCWLHRDSAAWLDIFPPDSTVCPTCGMVHDADGLCPPAGFGVGDYSEFSG